MPITCTDRTTYFLLIFKLFIARFVHELNVRDVNIIFEDQKTDQVYSIISDVFCDPKSIVRALSFHSIVGGMKWVICMLGRIKL